jgi:two-component system invasion response regulator UvrY
MVRILVADDHALVRTGIKVVLSQHPDLVLVAEAENAAQVEQSLQSQPIDLVVLSVALADRSGLDILQDIRKVKPELPVLFVSIQAEDPHAVRMIRAGANGYLAKSSSSDELVQAIRRILQGKRYFSESVASLLADAVKDSKAPGAHRLPHEALSDRELQVICNIAIGKSVSQIAVGMKLSVKTVSTYRARALEKMRMRTNAELTRYAILNHLVE